ncbi:hypothetical protein ACQKOE_14640 [Novosphingobium sp. NPDC080210]|uniref:hypothetical protein n=1 Tax=Novosphingobium sp. NPDC080210 TaxID=3390596 RepID=UPI003CFD6A74
MASDLARRLAPLAVLALAGCTGPDGSTLGVNQPDNFGEANRQTFAAQVIDPAPVYDDALIGGSGDKAAQAIERYRTDKVKQPERQRITKIGGSGGSDSGGGAGGSPGGGN